MKTFLLLVLGFAFLFAENSIAQHRFLFFQQTYSGTINGNLEIEVILTCEGPALSGQYKYVKVGTWIPLNGYTKKSGDDHQTEFFLQELVGKEVTGTWFGNILPSGDVTGKWTAVTGKKQLDLSLHVREPGSSVVFEKYEHKESRVIAENEEKRKVATATNSVLWPIGGPDQQKLKALQRDILEIQFGNEIELDSQPMEVMISGATRFLDEIAEYFKDDSTEAYNYMMDEYENRSMGIVLNEKEILTLDFFMDDYTGGVHPNYRSKYVVWNLVEMKVLTWDDIFIRQAVDTLRIRINKDAFENGEGDIFLVDEIDPLEADLVVRSDGILFFYDVYEVTPYVAGSWEIFYSWEELLPLIKPDSPVQRLIPAN